jgi:hypothetical protein
MDYASPKPQEQHPAPTGRRTSIARITLLESASSLIRAELESWFFDGALKDFISYYHNDTQAKEFCGSLDADLSDECLKTGEECYQTILQT